MAKPLHLELDRSAKTPLAEQIRKGISTAIESGVLAPGARLPSWLDLAAQLGVARGTVRSAYEKLSGAQLIVASRATGTHVADRPPVTARREQPPDPGSFMETYQELTAARGIFQMGVPAQDTFPATLFARIRSNAIRAESSVPPMYPDPRGELELRREIAAYLAIARGIECTPSQIIRGDRQFESVFLQRGVRCEPDAHAEDNEMRRRRPVMRVGTAPCWASICTISPSIRSGGCCGSTRSRWSGGGAGASAPIRRSHRRPPTFEVDPDREIAGAVF
jgi:DNA-binding transcriptional regulator YhcF (GntR family)